MTPEINPVPDFNETEALPNLEEKKGPIKVTEEYIEGLEEPDVTVGTPETADEAITLEKPRSADIIDLEEARKRLRDLPEK